MQTFPRFGDLKNSDFFEEYLQKIYKWRESKGLAQNITYMDYVTVDVEPEDRENYIEELSLMTPYELKVTYDHERYIYSVMEIGPDYPAYVIRVDKNPHEKDFVYSMNNLSPVGRSKPYTRYIGEVFRVKNIEEVYGTLKEAGLHFKYKEIQNRPNAKFICSEPSRYTFNTIGYVEYNGNERKFGFDHNTKINESKEFIEKLQKAKEIQKADFENLVDPIDHLATRVFHQNREFAILELMKLTSYYYWGSYDIDEQNSSTNVTRNTHGYSEFKSPAKVFTAGHLPQVVEFLSELKSPTEAFVMNYGPRMHHIAYGIKDNKEGQTSDNIDIVVNALKEQNKEFLLQVIGSAEEGLKQIFSKSSKYSYLITEYVQRYNGFDGFFTRDNVAFLTKAAGEDEKVKASIAGMGEKDLCD